VAENAPVGLNRTERILALMIASIGGLSVIAVIATIALSSAGQAAPHIVVVFPVIGLPVAFVLIVVFAILSILRRRTAKGGE
jgi:hypothetical protein